MSTPSFFQDVESVIALVKAVDRLVSEGGKTQPKPASESAEVKVPEQASEPEQPEITQPVSEAQPEPVSAPVCDQSAPEQVPAKLHYRYTMFDNRGLPTKVVYTAEPAAARVQPQTQNMSDPLDDLILGLILILVVFTIASALGQYIGQKIRALLDVRTNNERIKTNLSLAELERRLTDRLDQLEARLPVPVSASIPTAVSESKEQAIPASEVSP